MKYGITRRVLGEETFLEISSEEFEQVRAAESCLMQALFIEEKLNYVLENYCEFERELLDAAVDDMLFTGLDWSKGAGQVHTINRRVVNLLAACRLYLDQVVHNVNEIYGKGSPQAAEVKKKKSEEHNSNLGYRALQEMRNYAQHRGFPVHSLTHQSKLVQMQSGSPVRHMVTPFVKVASLAADKRFKPSVLQELKAIGETVDMKPLIRQYMESIGRIHLAIRGLIKYDAGKWEAVLKEVDTRFREVAGDEVAGLAVVAVDETGRHVEHVDVFYDFLERRQWLQRKNSQLTHFASHFVTSEVDNA